MMMKHSAEVQGLRTECGSCAAVYSQSPVLSLRKGGSKAAGNPPAYSLRVPQSSERGFTLVELIIVIVITGIIGGIVAVFLKAPIDQYMDVARRADMTDIADTALRRITRDLRTALPNSVRVTPDNLSIEFLPTKGSGRYRAALPIPAAGMEPDFVLDFTGSDNFFQGLGPMPNMAIGDYVVVYNLGIPKADAYASSNPNRSQINSLQATLPGYPGSYSVGMTAIQFPFESPNSRFQVITTPVSYVCDLANHRLIRYWGYAIQATQPTSFSGAQSAILANNVSDCRFTYDVGVTARDGLVTLRLAITELNPGAGPETVTLYSDAHVSNLP